MKNMILFLILISSNLFAQDPFNSPTILPGSDANMSQAVAFGDYDNDGWVDFILTKGNDLDASSYINYLFKSSSSGLTNENIAPFNTINTTSGTASWADIDDDGDLDLYIAAAQPGFFGSKPDNNFFINNGDGTFTDVTGNFDFGAIATDNEDSRHVGWGDFNNDGYPDIFIDNGSIGAFGPGKGTNSFYANDGDGTFTKESESTIGNIVSSSLNDYRTFGSGFGWSDFNNDGYLDIFNCSGAGAAANILWQNNPSTGQFDDVTPSIMQVTQTSFISCSWTDYDNDGDLDLFICNIEDGSIVRNFLYQNNSSPSTVSFTEMSGIGALVTDEYNSAGSTWGDFDNDGDLDVFVTNKDGSDGNSVATLYSNSGSGSYTFTKVKDYNFTDPNDFDGRGVASADINNDGFLDLVTARAGYPLYFENSASNSNNFVSVKLVGTGTTNKHALGSRILTIANIPEQSGTTTQLREISGQTGGGGQNDMRAHFGLGSADKIDEVRAQWLNSTGGSTRNENVYNDLPTNKFMVFTQGDLNVTANVIKAQNFMYLFGNTGGAVEFTTADADGGSLSILLTNSDPGGTFSGTSATSPDGSTITPNAVYSDRYWTITQSNLTGFNSTVYFDANGLSGSPDLDKVVLLKRTNSGSAWAPLNTLRIGNTLYAENVNSFSEFAIGYQAPGVLVEVKIFLQGAYDTQIDQMRIDINSNIPTTSPYAEDARTVSAIPANVVDWVLVQLRTTFDGSAVTSKSAFLHKDGRIVNDDASTGVIEMDAASGDYYIVIKHRNHLAIMSANAVSLDNSTSTLYDFTN